MSKKTINALNEKMQVKLPRELEKDNIIDMLESKENTVEVIEKPNKSKKLKKLVPLAASLALVIGLLSIFGNGSFNKKLNNETGDITEVMQYQSYDKIYSKFETLHKEAEKTKLQNGIYYMFSGNAESADDFYEDIGNTSATGGVVNESMNESATSDTAAKPGASAGNTTDDAENNRNYGTTNTQEQDVDEGDLIKTDGKYLYVTRRNNSVVSIVDIQDNKLEKISQIEIKADADIQEIYLNGKTLIIVGTAYDFKQDETKENTTSGSRVYYGADIAYGIGNLFVKVYDISNVKEPKLVTEYSQQGQYKNSRMIGTKLYCVSTYYVNVARDDYKDYCIPETTINGVCEPVPAGCISVIEDSKSSTYAVITTLDISTDKAPESEAILGNCDNLYASSQGMFLSENDWSEKAEEFTKIYRFEYTETGIEYKCMGKVPGYIKNQFAMSYDGEHFKIATTKNNANVDGDAMWMSIDGRTNNLYILNNQMQIVGKVEDLAKGETIQSVRYIGNTAYVVTFRQTDPLFVIDLSDPANPTVKGELKITGFSEYLHPITDTLLVGVGQDGTESGTNGDCKISLFDVSDPNKPFEASKVTVSNGSANVHSPVAYNHKCFVKLSENEFAVPFTLYRLVYQNNEYANYAFYIRYKIDNGTVKEVARYNLTEQCDILGGTYVGDTFFAIINDYKNDGFQLIAFSLDTNEEINRISLY
ncbi:MAG: beta-propeller domain-containing protein [Clostridia bacterium]|nr:beta-propeller domain-containing protein [Clostridia bacterium]